jgi:outer membrane protein OmpA-like peptidoglycan-associated protein
LSIVLAGALAAALRSPGAAASAGASIPTSDRKGAADSPLLKRYEGSWIVAYETQAYGELTLPLSPLLRVEGKVVGNNNRSHEPRSKKALEGRTTRLAYLLPEGRSPLEVLRNYQEEIRAQGGRILFECKAEECGGDAGRSVEGGGGDSSLAMYLYPPGRLEEENGSIGWCSVAERIADQRYTVAELPAASAHASVLVYTVVAPDRNDSCLPLNGRTIAVVDLVEAKAREQKMVTVEGLRRELEAKGHVALYLSFDFDKATLRPDARPILDEVEKLLRSDPQLRLTVEGHTDNVGQPGYNRRLSQARAEAVVGALAGRGIAASRLQAVGLGQDRPIADNASDAGRARNRRVELVKRG